MAVSRPAIMQSDMQGAFPLMETLQPHHSGIWTTNQKMKGIQ